MPWSPRSAALRRCSTRPARNTKRKTLIPSVRSASPKRRPGCLLSVWVHEERSSAVSNQVKQREQEDPHYVDKVPVQANHFNGRKVIFVEYAPFRLHQQKGEQPQAYDHMQSVHSGHCEIQEEQDLRVVLIARLVILEIKTRDQMFHPFRVVFETLNNQEDRSEDHGEDQEQNEVSPLAELSRTHRQHHRQAAADQHGSVSSAEDYVHELAGRS